MSARKKEQYMQCVQHARHLRPRRKLLLTQAGAPPQHRGADLPGVDESPGDATAGADAGGDRGGYRGHQAAAAARSAVGCQLSRPHHARVRCVTASGLAIKSLPSAGFAIFTVDGQTFGAKLIGLFFCADYKEWAAAEACSWAFCEPHVGT